MLGFEVSFKFADVEEQAFDSFFTDMVTFVDSRNLIMGGAGGTKSFTIYISNYERYLSASEEDRHAFELWLAGYDFIIDCHVEPLSDAYYGL